MNLFAKIINDCFIGINIPMYIYTYVYLGIGIPKKYEVIDSTIHEFPNLIRAINIFQLNLQIRKKDNGKKVFLADAMSVDTPGLTDTNIPGSY